MRQLSLTWISSALLCASCHHVYYVPNTAHLPLRTEKGEVRVNALVASGYNSAFTGGELQAAYAAGPRLGLMAIFFAAGNGAEGFSGEWVNRKRNRDSK